MSGTIVIGAGMAGLACARALSTAGHKVRLLDKGRGVGGRMATRRITTGWGELRFDHGAQYFTARHPNFESLLIELNGSVAPWDIGAMDTHHVGLPGMSGLPRAMAAGLDVSTETKVTSIQRVGTKWQVDAGEILFSDVVVLTVPAPQIASLMVMDHLLLGELARVKLAPCLTFMAAFTNNCPTPFVIEKSQDGPLASIARDCSKPKRLSTAVTWVVQAGANWSAAHLEEDKLKITQRMLPLLCEKIGADVNDVFHADSHLWRYARVTTPLGQPFLRDNSGTLYMGGDWCLGPRVESAWTSGTAIARDINSKGIGSH